jgi:hypothetical protein
MITSVDYIWKKKNNNNERKRELNMRSRGRDERGCEVLVLVLEMLVVMSEG